MNRGKRGKKGWLYLLCLVVLLGGYTYLTLGRPLPALKPVSTPGNLMFSTSPPAITWPASGQSAVSVVGDGHVITHGNQTPVPTASTAKILTALVVLDKKPVAHGQPGPTITLGLNDVALYSQYLARDGSVVPVIN